MTSKFHFLPEDWVSRLKSEYPKRSRGKNYGWPDAIKKLEGGLLKQYGYDVILQGTKDYCASSKICGDYGTEFIKMASSFYNQLGFLDDYETEDVTPEFQYRRPEELSPEQKKRDNDLAVAQMAEYRSRK